MHLDFITQVLGHWILQYFVFCNIFVILIHSIPLIFIVNSKILFCTTLILGNIKFAFGKSVWSTLILGNHKFWSIL
jgi:hypothetical protein